MAVIRTLGTFIDICNININEFVYIYITRSLCREDGEDLHVIEFHLFLLTSASPAVTTISSSASAGVAPNCIYTLGLLVTVMSLSFALIDV